MLSIITPTIGRETLKRTCKSLDNQSSKDFEHIVIFDGIEPNTSLNPENRIILKTKKLGRFGDKHGIAAEVRNYGLNFCSGDYIGFVDDDDTLDTDFVKIVHEDFKNDYDFILYTMKNGDILSPPENRLIIEKNYVGISFVVRKDVLKKYDLKFESSETEDFYFLKKMVDLNLKYLISPKILYYVNK